MHDCGTHVPRPLSSNPFTQAPQLAMPSASTSHASRFAPVQSSSSQVSRAVSGRQVPSRHTRPSAHWPKGAVLEHTATEQLPPVHTCPAGQAPSVAKPEHGRSSIGRQKPSTQYAAGGQSPAGRSGAQSFLPSLIGAQEPATHTSPTGQAPTRFVSLHTAVSSPGSTHAKPSHHSSAPQAEQSKTVTGGLLLLLLLFVLALLFVLPLPPPLCTQIPAWQRRPRGQSPSGFATEQRPSESTHSWFSQTLPEPHSAELAQLAAAPSKLGFSITSWPLQPVKHAIRREANT